MSYTIQILPQARLDIVEVVDYYEEQQFGLGNRFFTALSTTIQLIEKHPHLFQIRHKIVRQAPIKKFPISVFYIVDKSAQKVVIQAILHQARHPQFWKNR